MRTFPPGISRGSFSAAHARIFSARLVQQQLEHVCLGALDRRGQAVVLELADPLACHPRILRPVAIGDTRVISPSSRAASRRASSASQRIVGWPPVNTTASNPASRACRSAVRSASVLRWVRSFGPLKVTQGVHAAAHWRVSRTGRTRGDQTGRARRGARWILASMSARKPASRRRPAWAISWSASERNWGPLMLRKSTSTTCWSLSAATTTTAIGTATATFTMPTSGWGIGSGRGPGSGMSGSMPGRGIGSTPLRERRRAASAVMRPDPAAAAGRFLSSVASPCSSSACARSLSSRFLSSMLLRSGSSSPSCSASRRRWESSIHWRKSSSRIVDMTSSLASESATSAIS